VPLALTLEQVSWLATCVSAVGIVVAVGALWQQRSDSRVQLQLAMTQYVNETAKIFVEHPELRKYFHGGATLPTVAAHYPETSPWAETRRERLLAEAAVVDFANAMDFVLLHLKKLKQSGREAWENYFAEVWDESPLFREFISNKSNWYSNETRMWVAARQKIGDPSTT
jgi:hypothetical protein